MDGRRRMDNVVPELKKSVPVGVFCVIMVSTCVLRGVCGGCGGGGGGACSRRVGSGRMDRRRKRERSCVKLNKGVPVAVVFVVIVSACVLMVGR